MQKCTFFLHWFQVDAPCSFAVVNKLKKTWVIDDVSSLSIPSVFDACLKKNWKFPSERMIQKLTNDLCRVNNRSKKPLQQLHQCSGCSCCRDSSLLLVM